MSASIVACVYFTICCGMFSSFIHTECEEVSLRGALHRRWYIRLHAGIEHNEDRRTRCHNVNAHELRM